MEDLIPKPQKNNDSSVKVDMPWTHANVNQSIVRVLLVDKDAGKAVLIPKNYLMVAPTGLIMLDRSKVDWKKYDIVAV